MLAYFVSAACSQHWMKSPVLEPHAVPCPAQSAQFFFLSYLSVISAAFLVVLHTWNVLCVHHFIFFDPFYFTKYLSHTVVLLPQAYFLPTYEGHSGNSSVLWRICKDTWPFSHCFLNRLFLFDICSYMHKIWAFTVLNQCWFWKLFQYPLILSPF